MPSYFFPAFQPTAGLITSGGIGTGGTHGEEGRGCVITRLCLFIHPASIRYRRTPQRRNSAANSSGERTTLERARRGRLHAGERPQRPEPVVSRRTREIGRRQAISFRPRRRWRPKPGDRTRDSKNPESASRVVGRSGKGGQPNDQNKQSDQEAFQGRY